MIRGVVGALFPAGVAARLVGGVAKIKHDLKINLEGAARQEKTYKKRRYGSNVHHHLVFIVLEKGLNLYIYIYVIFTYNYIFFLSRYFFSLFRLIIFCFILMQNFVKTFSDKKQKKKNLS